MNATHAYRQVLSASTLEDTDVYNIEGEKLGEIEEIMINLHDGTVAYAVLEFREGFLNMKEKLFAVPWEAMRIDEDGERIILDVSKEKLENAPGFDKDDWPDMADPAFYTSISEYYGERTVPGV